MTLPALACHSKESAWKRAAFCNNMFIKQPTVFSCYGVAKRLGVWIVRDVSKLKVCEIPDAEVLCL